ncbi:MAG: hypothetical protein K0B09_06810 [Bacteroidales bacterium]|nr:hypothetical protein [Bacteroidales bacterium]
MFKQILKILLIIVTIGLISFAGVWVFVMTDGDKEVVELRNDLNGEKIYLIKQSWGLGDTKMAIGLNKRLRTGFSNSPKDKYLETVGTEFIFYKIGDGKLFVYNDSFVKPVKNAFKTEIVFIGLTNPEFIKLGQDKNYEKKGLKIFPESVKRRLNYADSLTEKNDN